MHHDDPGAPLDLDDLSPRFRRRVVVLDPGVTHPYEHAEWADAMVRVETGEVDLECTRGGRRRFGAGALLPLGWLSLRALHNVGLEPVRLTAISRSSPQTDEFLPGSSSERHDHEHGTQRDDAGG